MLIRTNKYLLIALLFGLAFHGTSIFFTLESTYDALIHLFFADHYANSWFEPWNYKWYTGFTVMSYPPLVHQMITLLSYIGGLKFGLFTLSLCSIVLFVTGTYRFSYLLLGNKDMAGYAALLCVLSSSFVETLHLFGQLPSIIGISILMHALPEIYKWIRTGRYRFLFTSLSLIAVTVCSHHVTPIFGMVFFIFPLIGLVIMDVAKEKVTTYKEVTIKVFLQTFFKLFRRIVGFGMASLILIVGCILPYWINTKNNPITQVPIPHGSRDNFIEITSSGLVFFLIPWGVLLLILPYIFYRYFSKRYLFFGLSITMLTVLGTGGTTPIPKIILGENAFNILTLDRFTLWATIMSLPLVGEFAYRLIQGDIKQFVVNKYGTFYHKVLSGSLSLLFVFTAIFTITLTYFRPSQPQKIKMLPIVNFLNQDQHHKWRYLTLGFGDQMAWLSSQTNALTVDGNYHSARRLPELTSRAIERLENSKFKGIEGIGSLQQFLTVPEKYNLKYIFSNDKFYDPILYFSGWQRLRQLENGIRVWERLNVPPIPSVLPKDDVSRWQKILWGTIPVSTLFIAFIINILLPLQRRMRSDEKPMILTENHNKKQGNFSNLVFITMQLWMVLVMAVFFYGMYQLYSTNDAQRSPKNVILAYYDALDFKRFEKAHSLIDPLEEVSLDQYMLEIAVGDGLLSSYAKLDDLKTVVKTKKDDLVIVDVIQKWITPLEVIEKTVEKIVVKRKNKWYLQSEKLDYDLPPNQLYAKSKTEFVNQGRRKVTTEQTYHEDVLKQPVLEVLTAKLVKHNDQYAIVGEIQNIDNVPADVTLKGTLYNKENKELASYNAMHHVKHKLLPKEISSFKIYFEGVAWSNNEEKAPKTYNPNEFTQVNFSSSPVTFDLQIAGNVSGSDLYKDVSINRLKVGDNSVQGTLFNSGADEVTVPQVLVSYYNKEKELMWVDHQFLKNGIRQQRKQDFDYEFKKLDELELISDDYSNSFVNGLPNVDIARKVIPNRIKEHTRAFLLPINQGGTRFIKVEVNNFIGNPD